MKIVASLIFVALLAFLLAISAQAGDSLSGRVVGVHDGDTLTILAADGAQKKIRLSDIDAPELKQPYGKRAKKSLSDLAFGKLVHLRAPRPDRYGRIVARVYAGPHDLNAEQLRRGWAWWYEAYSSDLIARDLADAARRDKRGLWAGQNPVAPWIWRRAH